MKRPLSLRIRVLGGLAALALLAGGFVAYKVANSGDPFFRRGGEFGPGTLAGEPRDPTPSTPPAPDTSLPTAPALSPETATTATTSTDRLSAAATASPTTAPRAAPTTTTVARSQPAAPPSSAAGPGPAPAAPVPPVVTGPRSPGLGTYTYAVDGEESASFFGSRRFPEQMTTAVHKADGLAADQLVFDLRYSDQHEEREIIGFRDDGIYFDFEGGSVTFGPRTETSESDYDPPMLQIPRPLEPGVIRTGVAQARNASGAVTRTEDWKVAVVGKEQLTVAGGAVEAWKVQIDRKSRPGSSETLTRSRTYWYDPGRAMWVKFTETLHAERREAGFTFSYNARIAANLLSFSPS